jgi:hypothetical protein
MFQRVAEVLDSYKLTWANMPVLVLIINEYKALLEKIGIKAKAAGVVLTGATTSKNNTMDALAAVVYKFCAALSIFAVRTKNTELHAQVFLAETDIDHKRDGDLIIFADGIVDLANKYSVELLTDYPVTADDVKELNDTFALAKKEMPQPEAKYSDKRNAQAELEKTFDETSDFLEMQLDKAIDLLHSPYETFYNAYYFSRNIKNIGIRHESVTPAAESK